MTEYYSLDIGRDDRVRLTKDAIEALLQDNVSEAYEQDCRAKQKAAAKNGHSAELPDVEDWLNELSNAELVSVLTSGSKW